MAIKGPLMLCLAVLAGTGGNSGCMRSQTLPAASIPNRMHAQPSLSATPSPGPSVTVVPQETLDPLAIPGRRSQPAVFGNPWKPDKAARDWKYIVIHHTASSQGSVESIHETHLQKKDKSGKPWLGIGYHFVIGNGRGMDDGTIEPTFRWREQMHGAHAGDTDYNQHGIGVCLVGNFEETSPSPAQMAAIKRLVGTLKTEYAIDGDRVVGHGDVKATACPGRLFPLDEVSRSHAETWLGDAHAPHDSPALKLADLERIRRP